MQKKKKTEREKAAHVLQIDQDLDHVDPSVTLWDVVQDLLCSTSPTQETCPRLVQMVRLPRGNMR